MSPPSESAVRVAQRMPLVRVIMNLTRARGQVELEDVLGHGVLKPAHKSDCARVKEQLLGAGDALYFHGGRTHAHYGQAALVLRDIPCDVETSPFALGALLCGHASLHADCRALDHAMHEQRGCAHPLAHLPSDEQRDFVASSNWGAQWRIRFADYLDAHFEGRSDLYFSDGRPPVLTGTLARHAQYDDWRAWTVEVRALEAIDLFAAFDQIMFWAIDPTIEEMLVTETSRRGLSMAKRYPFFRELRRARDRRIGDEQTSVTSLLKMIDRRVEEELYR